VATGLEPQRLAPGLSLELKKRGMVTLVIY